MGRLAALTPAKCANGWSGSAAEFIEYDVEADPVARGRMRELAAGQRNVPLLVEDGKVVQVGWQGRSCIVDLE